MNPEQPWGTQCPCLCLKTDIFPEISNLDFNSSPTTGNIIKKPCVVSLPNSTPTYPSIHQSGDHASIIFQALYYNVGRDQYIINEGHKL